MEIIHERAKLRLMDNTDVETLFSIVEGNREIWAYLISKMDSMQDMQQYVQKDLENQIQHRTFMISVRRISFQREQIF